MTYVYLLSDYEEHGATNVRATLDRGSLARLLNDGWNKDVVAGADFENARWATEMADYHVALAKMLERDDADLASEDGIDLCSGWGGIQLHVVKLE